MKSVRTELKEGPQHPFFKEISFFTRMNERQNRCPNIAECFITFPGHIFLSYCPNQTVRHRLRPRQEREPGINGFMGRISRVREYEELALVARWLRQLGSALEYVEKM